MATTTKHRCFIKRLGYFIAALVAPIVINSPAPVFAQLSQQQLNQYSASDIMFYDPTENNCVNGNGLGGSGNSDGSDVYMIGDSITVMSRNKLKEALPQITIDAQSSIWFSRSEPGLVSGVDRIANMGDQPILVFALGTNGGVDYMQSDDIDRLMAALQGKNVKVILMTIYYSNGFASEQMEATNARVKEVTAQYDAVSYLDWYAAASANPALYINSSDHTHPTNAGMEKFAEVVKSAVNEQTEMGRISLPESDGDAVMSGESNRTRIVPALKLYAEAAIRAQIAYGVPWEQLFINMAQESMFGYGNWAQSTNNWLGISGSGDAGSTVAHNHRFAKYTSVEASINAWAGSKVMRNGYYDAAFQYLDPNNYDFDAYFKAMIHVYCPDGVGGNSYGVEDTYYRNGVAIRGWIRELGYPSSEEIAKQYSIPIGGMFPIGTDVTDIDIFGTGVLTGGTVCVDPYAANGVTTKVINGITYAFPIAYATKENYLDGDPVRSVLSSQRNGWYHHDYEAVDLGIAYSKMVLEKDFSLSDYPQWSSTHRTLGTCGGSKFTLQDCEASTGAPVVAFTDGVVLEYRPYYTLAASGDRDICASVIFKSTVGDHAVYDYIHLGREAEFEQKFRSGDNTVKVGDVLGHIGLESCAQGTQAHVHFQKDNRTSVKSLINELYDALPRDAAELAARGSLGQGGLSYEQAKQFMINYGANKANSTYAAITALWYMCSPGGHGSNCVSFSAFFMNKFTKTNVGTAPGNGYQVVRNLAARGIRTGNEPKVWSVFSWSNGGNGHTGVILGYQNGEWIVGHASCTRGHNGIGGSGNGTLSGGGSGIVIKSSNLGEALWGNSSATYAYFDDQVDYNAIANYLSTGV